MLPVDWKSVPSHSSSSIPVGKEAAHSIPWTKPMLSNKKSDLQQMQSLGECLQFLTEMAKEIEEIRKGQKRNKMEKDKDVPGKSTEPVSIDHSKSLILSWAEELNSLDLSRRVTKRGSLQQEAEGRGDNKDQDSEMILKWARELQSASEVLGLTDDEFKKILSNHSLEQSKLAGLLPFLEFVMWCLLSRHSEEDISEIWLSTKQRQWKSGNQKYIPNSVWRWIQSASVDVLLDSSSCHPWLCVSKDQRKVREQQNFEHQPDNHKHFDELSCVLGINGFSSGRHYWEVLVPTSGSWKLGVASASASRKGRFHLSPKKGYWTIWKGPKNLWACTEPHGAELPNYPELQVVGVYVDYEEGQVSFYDAHSRFHIYTFTQTFKEELFPVFVCLDGNTVLTVHTP